MSIDILSTLQMMLPGSSLEVELTMQDGSTTKMALDVEKVRVELQEAKELAARAANLEKEADWLADHVSTLCGQIEDCSVCAYGNGAYCSIDRCLGDDSEMWREAARRAVEERHG